MTLLLMIFLHIIDDFFIQGMCLSQLKQKSWWTQQPEYKELYKYDYIMALLVHSFSWTFMIMLPIAFCLSWNLSMIFVLMFIFNTVAHFIIDNAKANQGSISLWVDQCLHIVQILITFAFYTGGLM